MNLAAISAHIHCKSTLSRTYHVQADNFTIRLLDLLQLREEIPEAGLCNNIVGSKDAHAVKFRGWVGIGGQMAADDLVLLEASCIFRSAIAHSPIFRSHQRQA